MTTLGALGVGFAAGIGLSSLFAWLITRCEHDGCVRPTIIKDHCDEHFPGGRP